MYLLNSGTSIFLVNRNIPKCTLLLQINPPFVPKEYAVKMQVSLHAPMQQMQCRYFKNISIANDLITRRVCVNHRLCN